MLNKVLTCLVVLGVFVAAMFSAGPVVAAETLISSTSKEYAQGMNAKISEAVAERLGAELEMKYVSFARRLVLLEEGKIDFCSGLHRNAEREKFIHYVEPPYITHSVKQFFVRKGSGIKIQSYEDLYPLNVATSIGVKYFDRFDSDTKIRKTRVGKVEQKFEMLMRGRVDVVIHSYAGAIDIANRMGFADQIEIAEYSYSKSNPTYIGISRKSKMMKRLDEVEPVIREMVESGEIERIMTSHRAGLSLQ